MVSSVFFTMINQYRSSALTILVLAASAFGSGFALAQAAGGGAPVASQPSLPGAGAAAADHAVAPGGEPVLCNAADCPTLPRINPFFGIQSLGIKCVIFLAALLLAYLLAVGYFSSRVNANESAISAFIVAIAILFLTGLMASWICFSEYTWRANWCVDLPCDADTVVSLRPSESMRAIGWHWWGMAAGVVIILLVVIRLTVGKAQAPSGQVRN